MVSEQTSERTFRVTQAADGRIGVAIFVAGRSSVVFWLASENAQAAQRLAHHLETQVDRVSTVLSPPRL